MAFETAGRIWTESNGLSLMHPVTAAVEAVVDGVAGLLVLIGLSIPGLLAILAELELLLGGIVAPLILPALAFGFTSTIGWGPVQFMVSAGVRVVVLGAVSFVMANAITATIAVPGTDVPLTSEQLCALLLLSLICPLVAFGISSLANRLVSGSHGALGWGTAAQAAGAVYTVGSLGAGLASGAVRGGAGAIGAASAAARGPGGGGGSSAGVTRSSGTGSAFP